MSPARRLPRRVLHGEDEPIFQALPETVLDNLRRPRSENALVWNLLYPAARPALRLAALLARPRLWGPAVDTVEDDRLTPYFWGHAVGGERLEGLDEVLSAVDGPGPRTEVDVWLAGERHLVALEAKHLGAPGRCGRFGRGSCPEVHTPEANEACRYWQLPQARFAARLDFGERPAPEGPTPPCHTHYQLARTLLVVCALAARTGRQAHLWVALPERRWRAFEREWLDFAERVRDEALWRRLRVLSWESLGGLAKPG